MVFMVSVVVLVAGGYQIWGWKQGCGLHVRPPRQESPYFPQDSLPDNLYQVFDAISSLVEYVYL